MCGKGDFIPGPKQVLDPLGLKDGKPSFRRIIDPGQLFSPKDVPTVLRENPLADQAKLEADAAAKAQQDSTMRRRRIRASSLLATGGTGDPVDIVTGGPAAIPGKPTLGA